MSHTVITPSEIISGNGSFAMLAEKAKEYGKSALLVTGQKAIKAAGFTDKALEMLKEAGLHATLFDKVRPEPTVQNVNDGRLVLKNNECDLVVGLGGGSAIDAAKAIAGLANEEKPTQDYHTGQVKPSIAGVPFIAVATTAGTGAEVTPNSVLTDPNLEVKQSLRGPTFLPNVAIADAELTIPCSPQLTAIAGMDALVQAIESYISVHSTPLTESLSLQATSLLLRSLERAVKDGRNIAARNDCMYGSLMAGIALCNARLGAVHGLAHPLAVRYNIPHGLTCAVLLPAVLRMNQAHSPGKFETLGNIAGRTIIDAVEEIMDAINMPRNFAAYSLDPKDFPDIAEKSLPSGSTKANPKKMTMDDFVSLLEDVAG